MISSPSRVSLSESVPPKSESDSPGALNVSAGYLHSNSYSAAYMGAPAESTSTSTRSPWARAEPGATDSYVWTRYVSTDISYVRTDTTYTISTAASAPRKATRPDDDHFDVRISALLFHLPHQPACLPNPGALALL